MTLTPKRAAFVREYVIDNNATQAAIRAGYSPRTAGRTAHTLLKDKTVKRAIAQAQQQLAARAKIEADDVLQELAAVAFCDPADLFKPDGVPKPIHEIPPAARRAVAGVKVRISGSAKKSVTVVEFKLNNKVSALEKLGRHLGLFTESIDVNVNGRVDVVETIVANRQQAKSVLAALSKAGRIPG